MGDTTARQVTVVTVTDPDSRLPVEVIIYKEAASGAMFGIDASFASQVLDFDPVYVPSLFDNGSVHLID